VLAAPAAPPTVRGPFTPPRRSLRPPCATHARPQPIDASCSEARGSQAHSQRSGRSPPPCSGALPRPDRPAATYAEQDAFSATTRPTPIAKSWNRFAGIAALRRALGTHCLTWSATPRGWLQGDEHRPAPIAMRLRHPRSQRDLPYDRFVRQQLAGDRLEPDNPEPSLPPASTGSGPTSTTLPISNSAGRIPRRCHRHDRRCLLGLTSAAPLPRSQVRPDLAGHYFGCNPSSPP